MIRVCQTRDLIFLVFLFQMVAFFVGYVIVLSFCWSQEYRTMFSVGSYVLWFLICLIAAKFFGMLKIPLFLFLISAFAFGFAFQVVSIFNVAEENTSRWKVLKDVLQGRRNVENEKVRPEFSNFVFLFLLVFLFQFLTSADDDRETDKERSKPIIKTPSCEDDDNAGTSLKNTVCSHNDADLSGRKNEEDSCDRPASVPYKKPHRVSR